MDWPREPSDRKPTDSGRQSPRWRERFGRNTQPPDQAEPPVAGPEGTSEPPGDFEQDAQQPETGPRGQGALHETIEEKRAELRELARKLGESGDEPRNVASGAPESHGIGAEPESTDLRREADQEIERIQDAAGKARADLQGAIDEASAKAERTHALLAEATDRADSARVRLDETVGRARRVSAEAEARLERILDGLLRDMRSIGDRLEGST